MFSYIILCAVFLNIIGVQSLSEEDKLCLASNNKTLNNDLLVGTWYELYEFQYQGSLHGSQCCMKHIITKLKKEEASFYEFLFKILNVPVKLSNPLYARDSFNVTYGVLSGTGEGKVFLMDPKYLLWRPDNSEGRVYRHINNNFLLYYRCEYAAVRKYLLSRSRNPDENELKYIFENYDEIRHLNKYKYCSET